MSTGDLPPRTRHLSFDALLGAEGWLAPAFVSLDPAGIVRGLSTTRPDDWPVDAAHHPGTALPGVPNLHSHAFQRAIVGRTEQAGSHADSFWSWREAMYACARRITPEQLQALAAQVQLEMLERGYTAVGEFHYLHHLPGETCADDPEMDRRILAAAAESGIALTHLPVLYLGGGFDRPPQPQQGRFVHRDWEQFRRLWDVLEPEVQALEHGVLGLAPHSLRAVPPEALAAAGSFATERRVPLHLHIAEQVAEVEECLALRGRRPVAWLLQQMSVRDWCLVHATHVDSQEVEGMARAGAVVGLCPTTEANLGDGVFPGQEYSSAGGAFGVGSDSQVEVDPARELELLEYVQRLTRRRRNVLAGEHSSGRTLLHGAVAGGARALAQPMGLPAVGVRGDFLVLDPNHPRLCALSLDQQVDAWIFAGARDAVDRVVVGGRCLVERGRHVARDRITPRFRKALEDLWQD